MLLSRKANHTHVECFLFVRSSIGIGLEMWWTKYTNPLTLYVCVIDLSIQLQ